MRSAHRRTRRNPTASPARTRPDAGAGPGTDTCPRPDGRDRPRGPLRAAGGRTVAGLAATLLLVGCSAAWEGSRGGAEPAAAGTPDVLLQPFAAPGPDPFTASTVRNAVRPAAPGRSTADPARQAREVTGSTPGLYGGTRSVGSCDVERQAALLTAGEDRKRAFAEAAGIPESKVTGWLRGLTPVALRADVRVTDHGYREGRSRAFQSVLQSGTAVLVDQYGAPRVRCARGSPLRAPATDLAGVHRGDPWDGFDPDRVIVVRPTTAVLTGLVIVNATDRSWIERRTGTDGREDRDPDVAPDCDPDACVLAGTGTPEPSAPGTGTPGTTPPGPPSAPDPARPDPPAPEPPAPADPPPAVPDPSGSGGTGTEPAPANPEPYPFPDPEQHPEQHPEEHPDTHPEPPADPYAEPVPDPYPEPPTAPDGELPPDQVFPAAPVPDRPGTFQG